MTPSPAVVVETPTNTISSPEWAENDNDVLDSSYRDGSVASKVTLPREEVLRLTTRGESQRFDAPIAEQANVRKNPVPPCTLTLTPQTTLGTVESFSGHTVSTNDPPSITLGTEQVLSLTSLEYQTTADTFASETPGALPKNSSSSNNNTSNIPPPPTKPYNRNASKSPRSSSGKSHKSATSKSPKTGRKKPKRTKSGGKMKAAIKKEKKSVDAVVQAAIRNYENSSQKTSKEKNGDDVATGEMALKSAPLSAEKDTTSNGNSIRYNQSSSSRTKPRRTKSGGSGKGKKESRLKPRRTKSGGDVGGTKKKKRSGRKSALQESSMLQQEHQQEHQNQEQERISNFPSFQEARASFLAREESSTSFQAIEQVAGAIAVFPSDSVHATQRRSITDHRRISDIDNSTEMNLNTCTPSENSNYNDNPSKDNGIQEEGIALFGSPPEERLLDNTNHTYEEIPEPPASQVIDATATLASSANTATTASSSHQFTAGSTTTTSSSVSPQLQSGMSTTASTSNTTQLQNVSTTDDSFLQSTAFRDVESGTVTAQAISSEDYYEAVRRQLQQEAVVAVDVVPLANDGLPKTYSGDSSNGPTKEGDLTEEQKMLQAQRIASVRKRQLWICFGLGMAVVILVGVLTPMILSWNADEQVLDNDFVPDAMTPEGIDNMKKFLDTEEAQYWRGEVLNILPPFAIRNMLADPNYMSPQYMAFRYLVDNAKTIFGMKDLSMELSPLDESKVTTIIGLVTLYHSTGGPKWIVKTNWLDPEVDVCEWHGVNCAREKKTARYLQNNGNNVSGNTNNFNELHSINNSPSIGTPEDDVPQKEDIIHIQSLDLSANYLCNYIPDEIGLLSNIHGEINLSSNELSGTLPTQLGMLRRLKTLNLRSNFFESFLPTELANLRLLRFFDVSSNPGIVGNFPEIRETDIAMWPKISKFIRVEVVLLFASNQIKLTLINCFALLWLCRRDLYSRHRPRRCNSCWVLHNARRARGFARVQVQ